MLLVPLNTLKPSSYFLAGRSKGVLLLWILFCYLCFVFSCHTLLSVLCSLVVTCCERADLLSLLHVMFSCVFITFPNDALDQLWYLIMLIPDLRLLPYFVCHTNHKPLLDVPVQTLAPFDSIFFYWRSV